MQTPRFFRTDKGVELIGDWPAETVFSRELLEQGDSEFFVRRFRTVTFLPGHQVAQYRIVGRGPSPRTYAMRRL